MKALKCVLVLTAFLGLILIGCADSSDQLVNPVANTNTSDDIGSLDKSDGIVHSATGSVLWKIDPFSGEKNMHWSFNAVLHKDGSVTGNYEAEGYIKAKVYDLKVSGNIAKLAFHYVRGPFGGFYSPPVDISQIYGWLVVIDNGEGKKATEPDYCSLTLFTDGSDIGMQTIEGINQMSPEEYLQMTKDYLLPLYGVPYEVFMQCFDNGSIQVR